MEPVIHVRGKVALVTGAAKGIGAACAAVLYIGMIQGLVMQVSIFGGKRSLLQEAQKIFPVFLQGVKKRTDNSRKESR